MFRLYIGGHHTNCSQEVIRKCICVYSLLECSCKGLTS
jgi:hypothetical protein